MSNLRTTMRNDITSPMARPWYRQFWPWFIIALPLSAVIASTSVAVVAFVGADENVQHMQAPPLSRSSWKVPLQEEYRQQQERRKQEVR